MQRDDVDLVAVADDDADGLKAAGQRLGTDRLYADYRQMLDKEQLDIVSVASRFVARHREMVLAAAAGAGLNVLLEKPIAATLADADEMIDACDKAAVAIGIAHQGRMNRIIAHAKQLVADGAVGRVQSAAMRGKEDRRGDHWDYVALDAEHRLVLSVVPGKRTAQNVERLVEDVKRRTGGRLLNLITTDEYSPYKQAILNAYGDEVVPPRSGRPGRPKHHTRCRLRTASMPRFIRRVKKGAWSRSITG